MALRGRIEDFGIAELLQLVAQAGKSGVITLTDIADELRVSMRDSAIVSTEAQRPMGSELVSRLSSLGVINSEDVGTILKRLAESGRHVCDLLVNDGYAPLDVVKQYATLQSVDILFEMFTWTSGDYAFEEGPVPPAPPWIEPIATEYLLMRAIMLMDEWPNINRRIKSHSLRVRRTGKPPPRGDLRALVNDLSLESMLDEQSERIGNNERMVYEMCKQGVQVRTVLDRVPLSRFEVLRAVCKLVDEGHIVLT